MIFKCFQTFSQEFQTLISSVSPVMLCMLQLNVLKIDRGVAHDDVCAKELAPPATSRVA
jgi:hypothetical protein